MCFQRTRNYAYNPAACQHARTGGLRLSKKLIKSTAVVGGMTLISRILGFIRDMVFARIFGADAATDAFFLAFKIPNFLRRLFAEGAFSQAFVPVFTEYKEQRSREELRLLLDRVAGSFALALLLISLTGVIAAPLLIAAFGPGFLDDEATFVLASDMLRLTFPYILFISLTAFAGAILNSFGRFAVPAFTPVFLNLCLIGAALWLAPLFDEPVMALAWGVFAAGLAQLAFQVPFLLRLGLLPRPRLRGAHEGVERIKQLMLPAIFGSSVSQINLLFDTLIASFLVTGSISWLYYSDRLVEFPLGVFGIALATVILPKLSRDHARASPERFSSTLDWALRWVWLIGAPAAVGLMLLAGPILITLFYGGEFGLDDVAMSRLSLVAYALGLLGFILVKVLAPGFYARQDTRTPVRIGIRAMLWNMLLNVLFVVPLVLTGFQGPHMGLALATAASAFINAGLLFRRLRETGIYRPGPGWRLFFLRVALANLVMGGVLYAGSEPVETWADWSSLERLSGLLLWIGVGASSYFLTLLALGMPPRVLLRGGH